MRRCTSRSRSRTRRLTGKVAGNEQRSAAQRGLRLAQVVDSAQGKVLPRIEEPAHLAGLSQSFARGLVRGGKEIPAAGLGAARGRGLTRQPLCQPGPLQALQGPLVAAKAHQGPL